MAHVIIISKDGQTIELNMLSFADGLNFARSYNNRKWDSINKVWNVNYTAVQINEDIHFQLAYNDIMAIMERGNNAYGNQVAFSTYDNRAAMGCEDAEYWTKQLLQNPDTLEEIESEIFSAMQNHIYNYR